jgi:hypothetical protein
MGSRFNVCARADLAEEELEVNRPLAATPAVSLGGFA